MFQICVTDVKWRIDDYDSPLGDWTFRWLLARWMLSSTPLPSCHLNVLSANWFINVYEASDNPIAPVHASYRGVPLPGSGESYHGEVGSSFVSFRLCLWCQNQPLSGSGAEWFTNGKGYWVRRPCRRRQMPSN